MYCCQLLSTQTRKDYCAHLKVTVWLMFQNLNISMTFCESGGDCAWEETSFPLLKKEVASGAAVLGGAEGSGRGRGRSGGKGCRERELGCSRRAGRRWVPGLGSECPRRPNAARGGAGLREETGPRAEPTCPAALAHTLRCARHHTAALGEPHGRSAPAPPPSARGPSTAAQRARR